MPSIYAAYSMPAFRYYLQQNGHRIGINEYDGAVYKADHSCARLPSRPTPFTMIVQASRSVSVDNHIAASPN